MINSKNNILNEKEVKILKLQIENEYYLDELYWLKEHIKTNKAVINLLTKEVIKENTNS